MERIAAEPRIEYADAENALERDRLVSTGVASTTRITEVAYSDHRNSGSWYQVRPGARRRWMVTMKLRPVRIDEKPATNTPTADQCAVLGPTDVQGRVKST